MFKAIFKRDVMAAWSASGNAASGMAFFGMAYVLMVMAIGVNISPNMTHSLLAVSLLLTLMLSLPSMLDQDVSDGSLEQYCLLPITKYWLMLAKMLAYWLAHMLPLLMLAIIIMIAVSNDALWINLLRLTLMSIWLTALGSIASAIALLHGKGVFARALIVLPLYVPALIAATLSGEVSLTIAIQTAATLFLIPLGAWVSGALLRHAIE